MSPDTATRTEIRPFQVDIPQQEIDELRRRVTATRWPTQGARRRSVAGRAVGDDAGARPLLDDRVRLAPVRGATERAAAVQDRDRRRGHPLHPREVAARERVAADHDARLARLGRRAARDRRPAHRPDRARRTPPRTRSTSCCRPYPATASRASRPSSAGTPAAPHSAWAELMHRLGYTRYVAQGGDVGALVTDLMGRQAVEGLVGYPPEPAHGGARNRRSTAQGIRTGTRSGRGVRDVQGGRLRLLPRDGNAAADDRLRPAGFTGRAGGLVARPRHGQLLQDLPRLRRRASPWAISPGTPSSTTSRCTG